MENSIAYFEEYEIRTLLVNFYNEDYQYREPIMISLFGLDEFLKEKKCVEKMLIEDKNNSTATGTFWASFSIWDNEKERWSEFINGGEISLCDQRIKIK